MYKQLQNSEKRGRSEREYSTTRGGSPHQPSPFKRGDLLCRSTRATSSEGGPRTGKVPSAAPRLSHITTGRAAASPRGRPLRWWRGPEMARFGGCRQKRGPASAATARPSLAARASPPPARRSAPPARRPRRPPGRSTPAPPGRPPGTRRSPRAAAAGARTSRTSPRRWRRSTRRRRGRCQSRRRRRARWWCARACGRSRAQIRRSSGR
mmetsp:Transcript_27683/g.89099  ORF Transcript_27683/g.89099 Transcript_27683/m.89099 type:complete len:209 (-) Transcript_27683:1201-1827(-)